jgi:hypothetical protein
VTTYITTETLAWIDVECVGCKQGVRLPVSDYGRRLCDVFPHIHVCAVTL